MWVELEDLTVVDDLWYIYFQLYLRVVQFILSSAGFAESFMFYV